MDNIKTVSVIGLGYIGLPTAATLANANFDVIGIDVHADIVETINSGDIHISEQGLAILVRAAVQQSKLSASTTPKPADAYIIAVPTPIKPDKSPDLSYIEAATRSLCQVIKQGDLVIIESTIPPRTCVDVVAPLIQDLTGLEHGKDYDFVHCPERVIPGKILHEIIHNDRIIGGTTPEATERAATLYSSFVKGEILKTTATTAEMCKLMENTFRDVNIALANELAVVAEQVDVDVYEAIKLANHHPRVNIHNPGIGVGGHCIPIDPWFIIHAAPQQTQLMCTARSINDARPRMIVEKVLKMIKAAPNKRLALFGLSYKPDVDDLRESPAVKIVDFLASEIEDPLFVVEPFINTLPTQLGQHKNLELVSIETALSEAHILVPLVDHKQFHTISSEQLSGKLLLDFQQVWPQQSSSSESQIIPLQRT